MPFRRVRSFTLLAAILVFSLPGAASAGELAERFAPFNSESTAVIDHSEWRAFLGVYLVFDPALGLNRVAYGAVSAPERARLDAYLERLAALPVAAFNRDEQLAYWINLYNALTVRLMLDRYPLKSIRDVDISPGLFADGPWGAKLVTVEGEALSLNDIEHEIMRPLWRDPLIHYGVNCASVGCPNLAPVPYTGANVHDLLAEGARAYVNSPRGVAIEDGRLVVSSIYDWYEEDFGDSEEAVLAHLRTFAGPELAQALERFEAIDAYRYDWSLNGAASSGP